MTYVLLLSPACPKNVANVACGHGVNVSLLFINFATPRHISDGDVQARAVKTKAAAATATKAAASAGEGANNGEGKQKGRATKTGEASLAAASKQKSAKEGATGASKAAAGAGPKRGAASKPTARPASDFIAVPSPVFAPAVPRERHTSAKLAAARSRAAAELESDSM